MEAAGRGRREEVKTREVNWMHANCIMSGVKIHVWKPSCDSLSQSQSSCFFLFACFASSFFCWTLSHNFHIIYCDKLYERAFLSKSVSANCRKWIYFRFDHLWKIHTPFNIAIFLVFHYGATSKANHVYTRFEIFCCTGWETAFWRK